jgi:hypothetical protein
VEEAKNDRNIEVVDQLLSVACRLHIVTEAALSTYCGLPTNDLVLRQRQWVQGATGTVWFHETFGLLQWSFSGNSLRSGTTDAMPYLVEKSF